MRTASRFVVVIVFLAVVLGGIFGYKFYQFGQMKEKFSQPQPPAVIEATTAQSVQWQPSLKAVGSIEAVNGIQIANEVPGVIKDILFESGDKVKKGDVLLRLDSQTDEAALTTRRAEERQASREFKRLEDLLPRKAVSQSQYDEAEANLEAARARSIEAQAQLNKKELKAPFAGTLGIRLVDQGEYLATGTPIVEINMLDPIYADYTISEKELANVTVGNQVDVTVAAIPDQTFSGKISAINSSVNAETRTVRIRATLKNPEQKLQPGMFATIQTLRPKMRDIVAIPNTAISFNTYGDFVYVIKENDEGALITERRSIETGGTRDGMVEVTKNLEAGERVVATGLLRLRAGQTVEIEKKGADSGDSADSGKPASEASEEGAN
ncbi:efflux RND transporter periplasmic adaptor subunit [Marinobacter sp. BGYM27]|uniref:efflux RND transporter periplasmic adaptor subunit n=1 Tax=Marinobacter sp. BGYM27 TaxID=2975597 RepID=UPI0021A66ABA|nr:efflux RND transporter periplasmic adaptor subunit [Marinobacter sp. BGYM27]MDG5501306.1 efflux RND transporter periplasmic adaptor subunit [Marinobacter sp. BGYM27]